MAKGKKGEEEEIWVVTDRFPRDLAKALKRRLPEYPKMARYIARVPSERDLEKLAGVRCKAALSQDGETILLHSGTGIESIIHEIIHINRPDWSQEQVEKAEEEAYLKYRAIQDLENLWHPITGLTLPFRIADDFMKVAAHSSDRRRRENE